MLINVIGVECDFVSC